MRKRPDGRPDYHLLSNVREVLEKHLPGISREIRWRQLLRPRKRITEGQARTGPRSCLATLRIASVPLIGRVIVVTGWTVCRGNSRMRLPLFDLPFGRSRLSEGQTNSNAGLKTYRSDFRFQAMHSEAAPTRTRLSNQLSGGSLVLGGHQPFWSLKPCPTANGQKPKSAQ